jgi:hypothetical protein
MAAPAFAAPMANTAKALNSDMVSFRLMTPVIEIRC